MELLKRLGSQKSPGDTNLVAVYGMKSSLFFVLYLFITFSVSLFFLVYPEVVSLHWELL